MSRVSSIPVRPSMHSSARRPIQAEWLPPDQHLWVWFVFYLSAALLAWQLCFLKWLSGTCDLMLTSTTLSMAHVLGRFKNILGAIEMDVFLGKCRKSVHWCFDGSFLFQFWSITFLLWEFTPKLMLILNPPKIITFHLKKNKQKKPQYFMF